MGDVKLGRFPPFTSFVVDIPDLKKDYKHKPAEQKMSQFVEPSHMAIFGRPLWSAYKSDQVLSVAKAKILGGKDHLQFNSTDPNHVFALLSVRLGLDVDLANPKALPLSQSAVHLHMRMVDWVDPATGVMATSTPSEPILSLAARQYLIADKYLWQQTIITFRAELLDKVVLDKGLAGELYARLILTLARDALGHKADLTFTVKEFLGQLYQKKYHSKIATIDPEILESSMNFLSFSSTKQMLPTRESMQPLLYVLLRRTSALQLAPLQSHLDQIVPFYMGKADEPFNWEKTGAIVIQVKNRKRPVNVSQVLQESFLRADEEQPRHKTRGSSKKGANPLRTTPPGPKFLFMLLDFDAGKTGLDVSISQADDPIIWAIQSKGHDKNLFRCLETLGVELAALRFFKDSSAETPDIGFVHHKDQLYNILYHDKIVTEDDDV